ncbi:hypothetical protein [uncultured Arcobacter sp.]|uniref:hypothetical protein n=1 Tax=uncultured Arcobacter sp. TaxID=165434 RepID=UPI00260E35AE|nr:hypothetical protein [uncultured Arcobacter sp.]
MKQRLKDYIRKILTTELDESTDFYIFEYENCSKYGIAFSNNHAFGIGQVLLDGFNFSTIRHYMEIVIYPFEM